MKTKYNFLNFYYFIVTFAILLSIGVNPNIFQNTTTGIFSYTVNMIRLVLPLFFLFYLNYSVFKNKLSLDTTPLLIKILIGFFFIIFIFSVINLRVEIFYFINVIYIFWFVFLLNKFENIEIIKKIFLFLLISYLIIIFFLYIYSLLTSPNYNLSLNNLLNIRSSDFLKFNNNFIINSPMIRSTGLARVFLFLGLLTLFLILNSKYIKIGNITLVSLIFYLLLSINSKFSVITFLLFFFIFIIKSHKTTIKKIILFFFIIILPSFINPLMGKINKNITQETVSENRTYEMVRDIIKKETITEKKNKLESDLIPDKITTGRYIIWQENIKYIYKNKLILIGKGIQADLIEFNITSSNGFIYSWLSGGLLCAIIYLFILLKISNNFLNSLLKIKYNNHLLVCDSFLFIFLLRSLIENSFTSIFFDTFLFILLIILREKINTTIQVK